MRTLFISDTVPYPPDNGKRQRIYHLLQGVARKSDVTLVARTSSAESEREQAKAECLGELCKEVHLLAPGDSRRPCDPSKLPASLLWWRNVSNHLHPITPALMRSSQSRVGARFVRDLCKEPYDLIWAETLISMALLTPGVRRRVIVDLDDIQHRKMAHKLRGMAWDKFSSVHAFEFLKLRRFERRLYRLPYEFVVCSDADKRLLNAGTRANVIANGVALPLETSFRNAIENPPTILFVGTMCYPPNVDAATYFVKSIFPRIRAEVPNINFQIVGHDPTKEILALRSIEGVTVTGSVPSVEDYLCQATLVVAPIRFGGGTRIKILEALAHRKAVVSTSVGAEGIDVQSGKHLLIADDPAAFAEACLLCLRNAGVRERIAEEGNLLVRQRYTWERIERQVANLISSPEHSPVRIRESEESQPCQPVR